MTDIDRFRQNLDHCVTFRSGLDRGKYGIFYKGERFAFTNNEYVRYDSEKRAYTAMLNHGMGRNFFLLPTLHWDKVAYKAAVDELLLTGELEIRQL